MSKKSLVSFSIRGSKACLLVCLLCLLATSLTSCKKAALQANPPQSGDKSPASLVKIDACSLATKEEVSEIQAAPIIAAASNDVPDGTFATSQCYYTSSAPDKSVTVAITQRDPNHPTDRSPQTFWHETFDKFNGKEEADEKEKTEDNASEKEREREAHPTRINGVGEEAFWVGSKFGGVLYVLSKDIILRISVGGPEDRDVKLTRSKALAQKALSRCHPASALEDHRFARIFADGASVRFPRSVLRGLSATCRENSTTLHAYP